MLAIIRPVLLMIAHLITMYRLEPDSAVITGLVKAMRAAGGKRIRAVFPTFSEFILFPATTNGTSANQAPAPLLSDQAVLTVAAMARISGNAEREVEVLDAHVKRHANGIAPEIFALLASAQLGK